MEKIIFTCKTVTPLVMNGAYGDIPELRPPGIKASLRFWWRALNGHLPLEDKKDPNGKVLEKGLRTKEAEIFGSTKGRSKLLIRIIESLDEIENVPLLEHRKGGNERETKRLQTWVDAFKESGTFQVRVDINLDSSIFSIEQLKNLFILSCALGGLGKRSRRGFGAVVVTEINGQGYSSPVDLTSIHSIIDKIVPDRFSKASTEIITKHNPTSSKGDYPEIYKIQIGKNIKTLRDIGQATHDTKFRDDTSAYKKDYGESLGDGRSRFASPVFVSILPNGLAVVTTLKKEGWISTELQNKLKNRILS